jgi:hypothetical protein
LADVHFVATLPILGDTAVTVTFSTLVGPNTADVGDNNGQVTGGQTGDTSISHRAAGRIGKALEAYEHALIPKRAAPFASTVTASVNQAGNGLDVIGDGSQNATLRWPTADTYTWNNANSRYERVATQTQAQNPFDWINQFGSPWP